jgi:hypothetical protein
MADPKAAKRYERKNFQTYFECSEEDQKKLDQFIQEKAKMKIELKELVKYTKDLFDDRKSIGSDESAVLRDLYSYIKEKEYDIFNLTEEQRRDLYVQKDRIHQHVNIKREFGLDTFFREKKAKKERQFQGKRYYSDISSDYTDIESIPQADRLAYTADNLKAEIKNLTGQDSHEAIREWKEKKEQEALARKAKQEEIKRVAMSVPRYMWSVKKSRRTIPMQFATRETY